MADDGKKDKKVQYDLFGARDERDKGMKKAADNSREWMWKAKSAVRPNIPLGWKGTGEDMRVILTNKGLPRPHTQNCWGPLTDWCVKHGILKFTGEHRQARTKSSHGRPANKVYIRI